MPEEEQARPLQQADVSIVRRILCWMVPAAYAICLAMILLDAVDGYRRIWLAEDVAAAIRQSHPADLQALQQVLGKHFAEMRETKRPLVHPERRGFAVLLTPSVWMHLYVECEGSTNQIKDIQLIYAASEAVSMENPRADLGTPSWHRLVLLIAFSLLLSSLWLFAMRSPQPSVGVRALCLVVSTLPLLLYAPMAVASLLRFSF